MRPIAFVAGVKSNLVVFFESDHAIGAFMHVCEPGREGGAAGVAQVMGMLDSLRQQAGAEEIRIGVCFPGAPDAATERKLAGARILDGMTREHVAELLAALPAAQATRERLVKRHEVIRTFSLIGNDAAALEAFELSLDGFAAVLATEPGKHAGSA